MAVIIQGKCPVCALDHPRYRKKIYEPLGYADRTGAGASPAVRRGKGLVEIKMYDVESYIAGAAFAGYFLPQLMLSSKITGRQKEIRKAMPDALDLLTICVEAGLGFDAAMAKVSEKWDNQLSLAFARTIREVQLGKVRRDALRDMADRLGIPEMTSFVAALIQSEQLGVSMAKILRIQSDQMRMKRRQRAEEEAHKAPVKMVIPMAFLMFPTIMIIILTPAALQIMTSL